MTMQLWCVGQYNIDGANWAFCGVFDSKDAAIAHCTSNRHFYAPATLNEPIPEEEEPWPGLVYPHGDPA